MNKNRYLFTSESVGEGHPDKLCDQISDAVLDECLRNDPESHVACETFASTALVLVGGEITTNTFVDVQQTARNIAREIGYTDADFGLDCDSMAVMNMIHSQSPDINQGVQGTGLDEYKGQQGAGDQGMMFGFACSETPELMPAPIMYAHKLLLKATDLRKSGAINWLRPDAKSQVTIQYEGHKPVRIDTVVISHQHNPEVSHGTIKEAMIEQIIKPVLDPTGLIDSNTKFFINPTGRFVVGGPFGDTGLTGRKIIVDTYGGMGRHGGGAFSGKDPSKVDRSAAYMCRYLAKNIVASGICNTAKVELSYIIGEPKPCAINIEMDTNNVYVPKIIEWIKLNVNLTPQGIMELFDSSYPRYYNTARYGHYGYNVDDSKELEKLYPWEKTDIAEDIKFYLK